MGNLDSFCVSQVLAHVVHQSRQAASAGGMPRSVGTAKHKLRERKTLSRSGQASNCLCRLVKHSLKFKTVLLECWKEILFILHFSTHLSWCTCETLISHLLVGEGQTDFSTFVSVTRQFKPWKVLFAVVFCSLEVCILLFIIKHAFLPRWYYWSGFIEQDALMQKMLICQAASLQLREEEL